jgi:hypothetical protein
LTEIDSIIEQLERQRTAIDNALAALREVGGEVSPAATRPGRRGRKAGATRKKRTGLTDEGRRKLAESMKRRWAVKRAASAAAKRAASKKRGR